MWVCADASFAPTGDASHEPGAKGTETSFTPNCSSAGITARRLCAWIYWNSTLQHVRTSGH
eukprot:951365-Amphidinium_carterae.1